MRRGAFLLLVLLASCAERATRDEIAWRRSFTYGSAPVQLGVSLSDDSLTAAATLHVELVLEVGAAIRATLPESIPLEGLTVRSASAGPPEPLPDGGHRERAHLVLEPTLPGTASIGPLVVSFEQQEGEQWIGHRLQTGRIDVHVASLGVPEQGPIEFKPPRGPAWPRTNVLPYLVAGIVGLAALFALVYWLTVRRARKAAEPIPPDRLALRELGDLERRDLLGRGELRRFYGELTDILRRYLERRFTVPALELTTEEVGYRLRSIGDLPVAHALQARVVLEEADLVKFAKHEPDRETAQQRLFDVKAFVRATTPAEEPPRAV